MVGQFVSPAAGGLGVGVWKLVARAGDVDFLLSFENQKAAYAFQFILDYGWWVPLVLCLVWALS